jgi:hypothetical protein
MRLWPFRRTEIPSLHNENHQYVIDLESSLKALDRLEQRYRLIRTSETEQMYERQKTIVECIQRAILEINGISS